jgi:acyl-CoA synthetase (NDP forming)
VHRSDRGLVQVGLRTVADVGAAVLAFAAELGREDVPVLVQPMESGVELAVGLVRDPVFGPLVMVATGGVAIDVWDDRAFLLAPVSASDAARALRSLRTWPLLAGHRGSTPCDVTAVEELVVAVGRIGEEVPQVAELDLNPVLVGTDGLRVVDLKVRLAPASDVAATRLRMLGSRDTSRES